MNFATLVLLLAGACCAAEVPVWHVAPDGNDKWSGTLARPNAAKSDGPLASLAAARDASRKRAGVPRRIVLAEGRLFLENTLDLDARDAKLAIEGAGAGKTIVYGGRRLTGWRRDGEKLWSVKLPADKADWSFRVLVVNDAIQDRARVPEKGYLEHETKFRVRWMSSAGGGWERKPTLEERTTMRYKPGDIPAGLRVENAEVTVCHMWDESTVGVAKHDPATRTLIFSLPSRHPPGAFGVPRYTVWNTREGMTRPGQWYLDKVERKVYYWPREGEDMAKAVVVAPTTITLIQLKGSRKQRVADIALRGFTLCAGDAPLKPAGFGAVSWPGVVNMTYTERVRIEGIEATSSGVWGVREWGSRELVVRDCHLHHLGGGGIRASGRIEGNHIHHIGLVSASAIGIVGGGTKGVVRRNVIHDTPYSGMCVSGTETLIEENLIYRCMLVHHDGAAIYMGGGKQCVIRRNVARDMAEVGHGYGVSAYYLDEKCRGCVVAENVSINIARPSHNHMTLDCELRDNVFIHDADMHLSFARCARHKVTGNVFHTGGKLKVRQPDAVTEWRNNRIVARDASGGSISEAMPRKPFKPRRKPRYCRVTHTDKAPTVDGKLADGEWPSGGTSLSERPNQRSVRGAPTSVKVVADDTHLYIATNVVTMFPDQRKLGTQWGTDEGIELVLEARQGDARVVHVLRGFTNGTFGALDVGGATAEQAAAFAKAVRYGASVDKKIWRSEWAVPIAALGVGKGEKTLVPFNLTVYRSEDDVFAQFAGTLGKAWDLELGGRLMLNWTAAKRQAPMLTVVTAAKPPVVDGTSAAGEWPGKPVSLAQTPSGVQLAEAPCTASVVRHGGDLYVRIAVPVRAPKQITAGNAWRTDDGAEVCIQGKTPDGKRAIWVVHGFANGAFELSDEAGVPAAVNTAVRGKIAFAAKVAGAGWVGEWRLPLGTLGIRADAPVPFNLGVFRSEDRQWINWIGTHGPTWKLARAGRLKLR